MFQFGFFAPFYSNFPSTLTPSGMVVSIENVHQLLLSCAPGILSAGKKCFFWNQGNVLSKKLFLPPETTVTLPDPQRSLNHAFTKAPFYPRGKLFGFPWKGSPPRLLRDFFTICPSPPRFPAFTKNPLFTCLFIFFLGIPFFSFSFF